MNVCDTLTKRYKCECGTPNIAFPEPVDDPCNQLHPQGTLFDFENCKVISPAKCVEPAAPVKDSCGCSS